MPGRGIEAAAFELIRLHPAQVPLPEEARAVTFLFQYLGVGGFSVTHAAGVGRENSLPEGVPAGQAACSRGSAQTGCRVEMVEGNS